MANENSVILWANKIVAAAQSYVGVKESPANSNNVIFNTHYYGHDVSGSKYSWCVAFVWDVFRMAGGSKAFYDGKKTAYCPAVQEWGKKYAVKNTQGTAGDLILFDWNKNGSADHIGIIESKEGDYYITIEGNTAIGNDSNGGEVMRRHRKIDNTVLMVIRPPYDKLGNSPAASGKNEGTSSQTSSNANASTCTVTLSVLRQGCKGQEVKSMQRLLIKRGYSCGWHGDDGHFGDSTKKALCAFQKTRGLVEDGVCGAITWAALLK